MKTLHEAPYRRRTTCDRGFLFRGEKCPGAARAFARMTKSMRSFRTFDSSELLHCGLSTECGTEWVGKVESYLVCSREEYRSLQKIILSSMQVEEYLVSSAVFPFRLGRFDDLTIPYGGVIAANYATAKQILGGGEKRSERSRPTNSRRFVLIEGLLI